MNTKLLWIITLIAVLSSHSSNSAVLNENDQNFTQLRVTTRRTTSRNPLPPNTIPPQTTSSTTFRPPIINTTQNYTTTVNYTTENTSNDYIHSMTTPRMPNEGTRGLMNEFQILMCLLFVFASKYM